MFGFFQKCLRKKRYANFEKRYSKTFSKKTFENVLENQK